MKFYYQLIVTIKKMRDVLSFFEVKTRNIQEFFASSEEKKTFISNRAR